MKKAIIAVALVIFIPFVAYILNITETQRTFTAEFIAFDLDYHNGQIGRPTLVMVTDKERIDIKKNFFAGVSEMDIRRIIYGMKSGKVYKITVYGIRLPAIGIENSNILRVEEVNYARIKQG